jgi:outer membrane protein TolC
MKMRTAMIAMLVLATAATNAQGPVSLSLKQALDMAAKQAYAVQSSELEAEKSRHQVKEITAMGLPQLNAEGGMTNYIDVPTQIIPNFVGEGPEYIPVQFGVPYSMSGSLSLSQLLFDGSYIVGLQASKAVAKRSQDELEKARTDARNQAAKAYYGALAADEGARLVSEGVPLLEKSLAEAEAMLAAGFMERTDVDRVTVQLEQARVQEREFRRQADIARMMLALTLGLPQGTPMVLTDELAALLRDPAEVALVEEPFVRDSHIDLVIADDLVRLQSLSLRNEKVKQLPSLNGFFNHQQVWNGPTFDPGGAYQFYPTTLWGLTLRVPIISSGMRYHRVAQARHALQQAEVNRTFAEQQLLTELERQRGNVRTATENLLAEQRNLNLARDIVDRTALKFANGASSSFELTQEQSNLLLAQQRFVQSVARLANARAELRLALDLY